MSVSILWYHRKSTCLYISICINNENESTYFELYFFDMLKSYNYLRDQDYDCDRCFYYRRKKSRSLICNQCRSMYSTNFQVRKKDFANVRSESYDVGSLRAVPFSSITRERLGENKVMKKKVARMPRARIRRACTRVFPRANKAAGSGRV